MTAETRYRLLLRAYPGSYRRRHGTEILTTLMDMADAGERPNVLFLVLSGVQQRFKLPLRRPLAVVAAVLAAVAFASAGAFGGTWLGWQTAAPVPSDSQARELADRMSDGAGAAVYPWRSAMGGPVVMAVTDGRSTYSAERIRAALVADGWQISVFTERETHTMVGTPDENAAGEQRGTVNGPWTAVPTRDVTFRAFKDGVKLQGSATVVTGGPQGDLQQAFDVWALDNGWVRPLGGAGLLAGAVVGWLLVAWVSTRIRRAPRAYGLIASGLGTLALVAAAPSAVHLYRSLYEVLVYDTSNPNPYIDGTPTYEWPQPLLAGAGFAVAALILAAVVAALGARRGSDALPTDATPA